MKNSKATFQKPRIGRAVASLEDHVAAQVTKRGLDPAIWFGLAARNLNSRDGL